MNTRADEDVHARIKRLAPKSDKQRARKLRVAKDPARAHISRIAPKPTQPKYARRATNTVASYIFALPYMGLMALSVLYPYFRIVRLPWFTMHAAYILIIGMAFLWVFVTGHMDRLKDAFIFLAIFAALYIFMMAHSLSVWVLEQDGMSQIKRGIGTLLYQLLGIMAVAAAYVLFGKRALYYTFWGYVGGNLLLLANAVYLIGAGDFVSQIIAFYASLGGEDTAASKALEVHDLTFAFGEFVIYFCVFDKGKRERWLYFLVACCFFLLGWKRIAIPGIVLGCAYVFLMRKFSETRAYAWTKRIGLILVGFAFAYLFIIRSGLFVYLCKRLGIDTMGRVELLGFIEKYYTLSPMFTGYGIGFITRMMQDFIQSGQAVLNAAMSIHNDILARYIELGFFGFTVWTLGLFYITPRLIAKFWTHEAMLAFVAALLFCFLSYLTDNTAGYFHINFCLRLFPLTLLSGAAGGGEEAARSELC